MVNSNFLRASRMQGLNATYFLGVLEGGRELYQSHFPAHIVFQIHFPLLKSRSYRQNSEKSHCYAYQPFSHHNAKLRPLNTTQQTPKILVIHACRKSVIPPSSVFIFLLLFSEPGWKHRSQCFLKSVMFLLFYSRLLKLMVNRHPYQPRGHGPARFLLCTSFAF